MLVWMQDFQQGCSAKRLLLVRDCQKRGMGRECSTMGTTRKGRFPWQCPSFEIFIFSLPDKVASRGSPTARQAEKIPISQVGFLKMNSRV